MTKPLTTDEVDLIKLHTIRLALSTPEARRLYDEAVARWDEKLRPLIEANRRAEQITGEDLNIIVGPCK